MVLGIRLLHLYGYICILIWWYMLCIVMWYPCLCTLYFPDPSSQASFGTDANRSGPEAPQLELVRAKLHICILETEPLELRTTWIWAKIALVRPQQDHEQRDHIIVLSPPFRLVILLIFLPFLIIILPPSSASSTCCCVAVCIMHRQQHQTTSILSNVYGSKLGAFHINSCLLNTERRPGPNLCSGRPKGLNRLQIRKAVWHSFGIGKHPRRNCYIRWIRRKKTVDSATSTACANHRPIDVQFGNGSRGLLPISWPAIGRKPPATPSFLLACRKERKSFHQLM